MIKEKLSIEELEEVVERILEGEVIELESLDNLEDILLQLQFTEGNNNIETFVNYSAKEEKWFINLAH